MSSLPPKKRLVSIRVKVAASTPVNTPVSVKTQLQSPIIQKIAFFSSGANLNESGFRVLCNGVQIIPAIESAATSDMGNESNFIPLGGASQEFDVDHQVPGSPYQIELQFYNLNGATPYYAGVLFLTAPKIELPKMPIQDDKLTNKPEYDS